MTFCPVCLSLGGIQSSCGASLMHILALAVDYDGTIAENGFVSRETIASLARLKESGRKLLLVTGRQLDDLRHACRDLDIFDYVIAENGAVLHQPLADRTRAVAPPPSQPLVERLSKNSMPLSVGHSIIATWHPHEHAVIDALRDLGLEHQIIFNKDAIMVLPANVNKATGLKLALQSLDICTLSVAGCGDAENDHSFLQICGCSAAVANALPSLKASVDIVLDADHGRGVAEFITRIIDEDDRMLPLSRRGIAGGFDQNGEVCHLLPEDVVLVAGNSGCGKSSYLTLLTERMSEKGHEFCVIDPEGDYLSLENAATIGGIDAPPSTDDALRLLLQAGINVVVNTMALGLAARKRLFSELMPSIRTLRRTSGHPQWLIIDEAHYILPHTVGDNAPTALARSGAVIATVDPNSISLGRLREVDVLVALGTTAPKLVADVARMLDLPQPPDMPRVGPTEFLMWRLKGEGSESPLRVVRLEQPAQPHHRHSGKYALGDVGQARSFYFNGIARYAHNLQDFIDLSGLLDAPTWTAHLKAHDYSAWFRNVIRDDTLSDGALAIERDSSLSADESRARIRQLIQSRYSVEQEDNLVSTASAD